jgi:hypothetical protein
LIYVSFAVGNSHAGCVLSSSEVITLNFKVEHELSEPNSYTLIPDDEHTDIEIPLLFDIGWDIHINSGPQGGTTTRIETEAGMFALTSDHQKTYGGSASFQFIGVNPGETYWRFLQGEEPSPGFDSQDILSAESNELCLWDPNDPAGNTSGFGKWLQVNLVEVRGPVGGHISLYQESGINPNVFFSTFDGGITEKDVYFIQASAHAHNSWAFTEPGLYEVDIQISTFFQCDETLTADLNDDCFVNMDDYSILSHYWLQTNCGDPNVCPELITLVDPNEVDLEDLNELTGQWLNCGTSFTSECP